MDPHELKERLFLKEREKKGRLQQEERGGEGGGKKINCRTFSIIKFEHKIQRDAKQSGPHR